MLKPVFGITFCVLLAGCGGAGSSSTTVAKAGNVQLPPECESYFKRLAACNGPGVTNTPEQAETEFQKMKSAWNPNDPQQMSVAQCKQMDATLAAGGDSC